MRTHHWILLAAVVLGLALRVPGWFTQDDKAHYRLFEPDEIQHVEIALIQLKKMAPDLALPEPREQVNARGYGKVLGVVAYGWWRLSGQEPSVAGLVLTGRQLSTGYFLLLLFVTYRLACQLGLPQRAAAWATLLLALCDLNASYSHYAVPASGYLLLLTVFMWGGVRYWRERNPNAEERNPTPEERRRLRGRLRAGLLMALGAGGSFAFKFDFLPAVVGVGVVPLTAAAARERNGGWRGAVKNVAWELRRWRTLLRIGLFLAATVFCYQLCVAFNFSWGGLVHAFRIMSQENRDVIARDLHWLLNPSLYLLAVVAGIGLPACAAALFGAMRLGGHSARVFDPDGIVGAKPQSPPWWRDGWWIPAGLLLLEFGVRWSIDTPFVRRANEFMPLLAILAAYGLHRTWLVPRAAHRLRLAVAAYGLALCLVGQSNHWFDTRVRAREWLLDHYPTADWRIGYTEYTRVKGSPESGRFRRGEWDILATAEPWYGRFSKSFTTPTPGRYPDCASEIYHSPGLRECDFFQQVLAGEHPHLRQIAHFRTRAVLPEHWLYRALFGTFETFLGDVRLYEWTATDTGPPNLLRE